MLAGRRADNGRQKTRNHEHDVIVGGELFTDYSDHPRKLVTLNLKSNQQAPDATSFFPLVGCHCKKHWKTSLRKCQDAVVLQQIKERGANGDFIVVISVRQSTVAAISGLHCWRWLRQFEHKADSLIAKFKEVGGTVRETMWLSRSPRLSPLWLSASSFACHGLLIITVITPLPTKPSATKCQRTEAGERGNYWHADASAWCCCADANTRRELAGC